MKTKVAVADVKEFYREKYKLLDSTEISKLDKRKGNCLFDEWYEALQAYTDSFGEDWERSLVTDCGYQCWKDLYEEGYNTSEAFKEGFDL